jgi:hypothetical protein
MNDYQNDYREMYEELRALVRLYFEIKYDDGTLYNEDEWEDAFDEVELEVCTMVGLIDGEEVE